MSFSPRDAACVLRIDECLEGFEYSLEEFEIDLWRNRRHIAENIRMARGDQEIYPVTAPARQDALQWIFQAIAAGYTAIFYKLNFCNLQAAEVCCAIDRNYPPGAKSFVTAFLSPSSHGCFTYHYDEVDVFLIQVYGEKGWSVAAPSTVFPVEGMSKGPVDQDQGAREYLRVILKPGDVLYIPRGHIHKGMPGGVGSLHLSAGVHVPTVAECLSDWIQRRSFDFQTLRQPASPAAVTSALSELPTSLFDQKKAIRKADFLYLPGNTLETTLRIGALKDSDKVRRNQSQLIEYSLSPDLLSLEVWGRLYDYGVRGEIRSKTVLPAAYFIALQYINQRENISLNSLAEAVNVTPADAVELCRRLLTIGVLEIVDC